MYQNSVWATKYTSYNHWLSFPFRPTAKKSFPILFKKQTGLELSDGWKDPPINSVTKTYINRMRDYGFEPDQDIDNKHSLTGISIPLLLNRHQLGGFLVAYRARVRHDILKWVKYTHSKLIGSETPLISISGAFRTKPDGLLVDNLTDYFKLMNWVYCQKKTYAIKKFVGTAGPPLIIYIDHGDRFVIEQMRIMQLYFKNLTDFTGRFVEEIKSNMDKSYGAFNVDTLHYFDENPLPYCNNRIQYEDAMANLRSSCRRKTLLECSEQTD